MARLAARLKREGITWPQAIFQFVIVLLGVYLAILMERKAEERSLREDTAVMLQNVVMELEEDEEGVVTILGIQEVRIEVSQRLADLLGRASQADAPAADSLVTVFLANNRTAFVRGSAYRTMVAGGYLRSLVRTDLPRLFADLYERTHARVTAWGDIQDKMVFEYLIPAHMEHLDVGKGEFIQPGPEANTSFRNVATRISRSADTYRLFLEETLVEIREVRRAVEEHLEGEG